MELEFYSAFFQPGLFFGAHGFSLQRGDFGGFLDNRSPSLTYGRGSISSLFPEALF